MSLEEDPNKVKNLNLPISIGDALIYLDESGKFERLVVGGLDAKITPIEKDGITRTTIEFSGAYRVIVSLRKGGLVTSIVSKALDSKSVYHEIIVFDENGNPITKTSTDERGNPVYTDY